MEISVAWYNASHFKKEKKKKKKERQREGERERENVFKEKLVSILLVNHFHKFKCKEETADSGWLFECQRKKREREGEEVSEEEKIAKFPCNGGHFS